MRGTDYVGGFGFFSYWTEMPLDIAWETFGRADGVGSLSELRARVGALRSDNANQDDRIGCVILSDTVILPQIDWISAPRDWKPNIVRVVGYDIAHGEGARVWDELRARDLRAAQPAFSSLVESPDGYATPSLVAARRGQGAFRMMVTDAYGRRCAITGERTLPALDAAHIVPYSQNPSHDVRNGILMRSDVHRLYDLGFVTVEPDHTFRVSSAIERDYSNGKIYYALDGKQIAVPELVGNRPDLGALAWHAERIFRP